MRNITKTVKHIIDEREYEFEIRKMDALKGSLLAKLVIEKLIPMFDGIQSAFGELSEKDAQKEVNDVVSARFGNTLKLFSDALAAMTEEEVLKLEKMCLHTVQVRLPAGWQPVMTGDSWGFDELEYEPMVVLMLCYEVIEFNAGSFFGGKSLTSLQSKLNTLSQKG